MAGLKALIAGAAALAAMAAGSPQQQPKQQPQHQQPKGHAKSPCDRWADPHGSNRAKGSWSHPVRTPRRLVKVLRAGHTGCFRGGTYDNKETIIRKRDLTLRSAPGQRATWRGRIVLAGKGDRLTGLSLDGSYGPPCDAGGCILPSPTINATDVTVAWNDIKSPNAGICVNTHAWRRHRPNGFRIVDNRIHDCGRLTHTGHDHGIYVADGDRGLIARNVIYDNADRGIQLYPDARRTHVVHNTVDGNGSGVIFSEASADNVVRDNVFTNAVVRWNAEAYQLYGHGNRFTGNCVKAGNPRPQYNENGGVALPRLVAQRGNRRARDLVYTSRATGDYRIAKKSGCAGKGAPASVARGKLGP